MGAKGRRERSGAERLRPPLSDRQSVRRVHFLRPVFVVPQRLPSNALREFRWIRLHMVGHKQYMVKLGISVIPVMKSARDIGFVGDGQKQAKDARIIDLLIDIEATHTAGVFVKR